MESKEKAEGKLGLPSINSGDVDHLSLDMSDEPLFSPCSISFGRNINKMEHKSLESTRHLDFFDMWN